MSGETNSIIIPKSLLSALDLRDGDIVEGTTRGDAVAIRVVCRTSGESTDSRGREFVEKWLGRFASDWDRSDPLLDELLNKHVK